jgi:hypothetical protein
LRSITSANQRFATYNLYETVTPELLPFTALNDPGSNRLLACSDGAVGAAQEYAQSIVRGGKITFGFDQAYITATPYFTRGAAVESTGQGLELSAANVPIENEYTQSQAQEPRNRTAFTLGYSG